MVLNLEQDVFVVHVTIFFQPIKVYSNQKIQIAALIADKALITVSAKYSGLKDMFSKESTAVLPEHTEINTHVIILEEGKQPLYGPIYSLKLIELETPKIYINTNLANGFIYSLESLAGNPILFNRKPNRSFWLYINHWGLNNLIIKNQYLLLLIGESLHCLGHTKQFTELDFTNVYYWIRIKKSDKLKSVFWTRYSHFEY